MRWKAVIDAADAFGLAPITGSSTNVGVVGYLLGGGLGPLGRSHGFSSDYVRGFTLVTPTGEIVEVGPDQHADLFWALRGGKLGLGIVTSVRVELVPMPELYAGSLAFQGDDIEPAYRAWVAFTATAPDDVTTSAALMHFPPLPFIPEVFRGKDILMLRFARPGTRRPASSSPRPSARRPRSTSTTSARWRARTSASSTTTRATQDPAGAAAPCSTTSTTGSSTRCSPRPDPACARP